MSLLVSMSSPIFLQKYNYNIILPGNFNPLGLIVSPRGNTSPKNLATIRE